MYDLCCLAESDAFQADIVQGDQATACRQTSQWKAAAIWTSEPRHNPKLFQIKLNETSDSKTN